MSGGGLLGHRMCHGGTLSPMLAVSRTRISLTSSKGTTRSLTSSSPLLLPSRPLSSRPLPSLQSSPW